MSTKPKLLITGATGFLGQELIARLVQSDQFNLRCSYRNKTRIPTQSGIESIDWVEADLLKPKSLQNACQGVDAVVNLAGLRDFWTPKQADYYALNQVGAENLAKAAQNEGIKRFIQISTPLAFGMPEHKPFDETSQAENHPSHYGYSKYLGDKAITQVDEKQSIGLTILYFAAIIGANDPRATMEVERCVKGQLPALVGADTTYTYLYIKDAIQVIEQALTNSDCIGERYLIGNQRASTQDYFALIAQFAGQRPPTLNLQEKWLIPLAKTAEKIARWTGKKPIVPVDLLKTSAAGSLLFSSKKAEQAFNINYHSLAFALEEAVKTIQAK